MIKIVFFDIDGTLLPFHSNEIPESTKESIRKLKEKGIKCFVATGKSLSQMLDTPISSMNFDGYITLNGQLCYDNDYHMIYGTPIDPEEMKVLEGIFNAKKIPFALVGEFSRYINYVNDLVIEKNLSSNSKVPGIDKYKGEKIYQITAYVSSHERKLLEDILDLCSVTAWDTNAVDIVCKNGGKIKAVEKMLEMYGISQAETMAFGDGENDMHMIQKSGIGVAMGNAMFETKAVADYITTDCDKDGIKNALEHFGII